MCVCVCVQVRELELNADMNSVNNLLDFLEKIFNGGSDFNEPIKRCLDRLTDAKWANSDILLVSGAGSQDTHTHTQLHGLDWLCLAC